MYPRIKRILSFVFLVLCSVVAYAQSVPDSISYQAVVRDLSGNEIANESVTIEFAIRSGNPVGPIVFEEFHSLVNTNQYGLFSVFVGNGVPTGNGLYNSLTMIPWEMNIYFLEVRATIPGQGAAQIIGVSQLLTVPYAFYAAKAGSVITESDGDTQNELIDDFYLNGSVLTITENNADYSVDLSGLAGGGDADADASNELITDVVVTPAHTLQITEASTTTNTDLSTVAYATWSESSTAVFQTTQNVGIGTEDPKSTLDVNGSVSLSVISLNEGLHDLVSNPSLASKTVFICNVTSADVSIELVSAATCPGRIYKFRKFFTGAVTSNDVNIAAANGETVDGQNIYGMNSIYAEYLTIISDGNNWFVIDHAHE